MASLEEAWEALTRTDDLLAEILIHLPILADHGRACAAYAAFRRVITDPSFRRRLHALHPPSLLGFRTFSGRFEPVEPPHPSAPAARALKRAADFRFSFLPEAGFWLVRDARGGRFVLDRDERGDGTFTTIAVCDPLFRRYVLLPPIPIPDDLTAAVQVPHVQMPHVGNGKRRCDIFLAPCGKEEGAAAGQPQSFRVIWMAQYPTKLVAFVFSSASMEWRAIASLSWGDLDSAMPSSTEGQFLFGRSYAYGCFYWSRSSFLWPSNLVVLDTGRMEFCLINSPPSGLIQEFATVELGESRLGMFVLAGNQPELRFFCANRQNHGGDASEWVLENKVSLSGSYQYHMIGNADGKLFLQRMRCDSSAQECDCISVDFKTLQFQRVQGMLDGGLGLRALTVLYTGYPPSLSSPTI